LDPRILQRDFQWVLQWVFQQVHRCVVTSPPTSPALIRISSWCTWSNKGWSTMPEMVVIQNWSDS
jgi:hypothetical protein